MSKEETSSPLTSASRSSTPPPGAAQAAVSAEPDKTNAFYKTLTENAYQYYCKAMYYYKENEIEGSLINFLLALNNLYNVKTLLGSEEYVKLFQEAKEASLAPKQGANEDSKKTLITSNFQACQHELADMDKNIDNAIDKVLSYVRTLQEQLKRIKNDRGSSSSPNKEDDVPCKDVKQDFISGNALTFDDVSGQDVAKDQIRSGILYPLIHPRLYPNSSKGILFYGPPGTGKTLLAKAFVNQLQKEIMNSKVDIRIIFYAPTGAELKGKYVGETEKKITNYFRCAAAAATSCTKGVIEQNKSARPDKLQSKVISVLFIDEVEAIAGNRDKDESGLMTNSVNALLQMMDGVSSNENVIVMAATNYPWKLDEAVLRRFDTKIYIKLPTAEDIEQQIKSDVASSYIMKALTKPKNILPDLKKETAEEKTGKLLQNKDSCTKVTEKEVQDDIPKSLKLSCDDGKVCLTPYTGDATALHPVKVFDFYRKLYFPEFTDQQIRLYSQNLAKNHYSGGDVKNICRYVYKLMGNRAKKIGKFNTETGILDPKQLTKADMFELDKLTPDNKSDLSQHMQPKIIYNACDENPFEFKTFHTGGSIDMRHYSYSEEPSFLILNLENSKTKKDEQLALVDLMKQDTSVFFSSLIENTDKIYSYNSDLFIKLDVIPDNISKLVEAFLGKHPLDKALAELKETKRELEVKLSQLVTSSSGQMARELYAADENKISNLLASLRSSGIVPAVVATAAASVLVTTGVAPAMAITAVTASDLAVTALFDYLVTNPNALIIVKIKNNIFKLQSIIEELSPERNVSSKSAKSVVPVTSSASSASSASNFENFLENVVATVSPVAAPAQAPVAPVSVPLKKYKEYIKKYLLSMYSTLDQLFQSCKNNSQKSFYIDYYDFMLIDSKSSEIFIPTTENTEIGVMIHQQLSIHPKLSSIPFKKDFWVHIKLKDDLLDGIWGSLRRGIVSYSGGFKYFFTDYVPGKVSYMWNSLTSYLVTSNNIENIDIEKIKNDNQVIDFIKLKTLEDASRMTNIYKMAVNIFCLEDSLNQISQFSCIKSFDDTGGIDNSPANCLSQGRLWREEGNCGDLTKAITGFIEVFKKEGDKKTFLEDEFTLNRFLKVGATTKSIFTGKIYFTDPKQELPQSELSLYKHMYMIKDASPETIYIEIAKNIDSKFPSDTYTRFTKYKDNGIIIDESKDGENGSIRMIKGKSYFVKNDIEYHELFTLDYPVYTIKSAGNQIVDHRTLVYKKETSSGVNLGTSLNCLDELEDSRYINFSFNYGDFMTAINFTNTDSIKPTVKQFRVSQLDAYSRNEDIPKDPNDK